MIQNPDLVVRDGQDPDAVLYIKWYKGEPYLFVCRVRGEQFNSVTAYPLESRGKLEALLRQKRIYTSPGFQALKKSEVQVPAGIRLKRGRLEHIRPYIMSRDQIRAELKRDRIEAARKHGVDSPTRLRYEGPFVHISKKDPEKSKYIHQWTIIQPGHPSHGSTVAGFMYDVVEAAKRSKKEGGEKMEKIDNFVLDLNKFKSRLSELRKSRLIGKKIPVRTVRGVEFYKSVREGVVVKGQGQKAKIGDKVLIKGILARVTAVGKDGITARDAQNDKYQAFFKDVELIRKREELRK